MDEPSRVLGSTIAQHIVARDFPAARALFAPWFQESMTAEDLERMIDEANEGLAPPVTWTLDENPMDLASLREVDGFGPPSKPFAPEITDANYRGWICVQFQPDPENEEGFDVCFDLWLAAVDHQGVHRVGYLEAWEAT